MKRFSILFLSLVIIISSAISQNIPSIKIDGKEILASDNTKFPYWLEAGQSLDLGSNVKFISVLEYIEKPIINGNGVDLVLGDIITVKSLETVQTGKVWKVESLGLDLSTANIVAPPTSSSCPAALQGEVLIDFEGCLYVKEVDEPGTYYWADAINQCENLGQGWYLPISFELVIMYEYWNQLVNNGICKGAPCPLSGFTVGVYWSSTMQDADWAETVTFTNGAISAGNKIGTPRYVRCVRR